MNKQDNAPELDGFLTERGLRRLVNNGYRQAFMNSPEGFDWYERRGSAANDRIKFPSLLENAAEFIATYHPTSPARMTIAMASRPREEMIAHLINKPSPNGFLQQVRHEVRNFICTNDSRYIEMKRKIRKQSKKSQLFVVSSISGIVGRYVGAEASVVVPLVAICLISAVKIGKEAYCREIAQS